jgi:hypothetical protein
MFGNDITECSGRTVDHPGWQAGGTAAAGGMVMARHPRRGRRQRQFLVRLISTM